MNDPRMRVVWYELRQLRDTWETESLNPVSDNPAFMEGVVYGLKLSMEHLKQVMSDEERRGIQ